MNARLLSCTLAGVLFAACATPSHHESPAPQATGAEEEVVLTCAQPMSLTDFIKLAQSVSQDVYVFKPSDTDARFSWVGDVRCPRSEVRQFVQTMLRTKGLALEARQNDDRQFFEVVRLSRG